MKKIRVEASKNYDVVIEKGAFSLAGEMILATCQSCRYAVVSDSTVFALYAPALLSQLPKDTEAFVFAAGEESKSITTLSQLLEFLAQKGYGRGDVLIALGGGVTGDLCGFAAAIYMRGIRFVQIPTTLLAMVDSSVGGKTGVDLAAGKNLCGAFWQPELVICDPLLLKTLSPDVYRDGMAEVIKYGIIKDEKLFFDLYEDKINIEEMIARCVEIKRDIVNEDEKENGIRALLNFGHTPAHAIEKLSSYKISHGAAVATGMIIMARAALTLGFCDNNSAADIEKAVKKLCTPAAINYTAENMALEAMGDKKRQGDKITLVLPKKTGEACCVKYSANELCNIFRLGLGEGR